MHFQVLHSTIYHTRVSMQVNFLTKMIGLKPGPDLHKKLARVLGGEDEGADIIDEEKARQIARAQNVARNQVGPTFNPTISKTGYNVN